MTTIECPDCGEKIEIEGFEDCIDCPECDTMLILGYDDNRDTPGQRLWQDMTDRAIQRGEIPADPGDEGGAR